MRIKFNNITKQYDVINDLWGFIVISFYTRKEAMIFINITEEKRNYE